MLGGQEDRLVDSERLLCQSHLVEPDGRVALPPDDAGWVATLREPFPEQTLSGFREREAPHDPPEGTTPVSSLQQFVVGIGLVAGHRVPICDSLEVEDAR